MILESSESVKKFKTRHRGAEAQRNAENGNDMIAMAHRGQRAQRKSKCENLDTEARRNGDTEKCLCRG